MKTTNKIYPKEWLELHPYLQTTSADLYYTGIANRIYKVLLNNNFDELQSDENIRIVSCCVAAYLEDQISETGIWRAFTSGCRKLYNKPLPFYAVNDEDYYDEEVNYADICFLLWHCLQSFQEGRIINPENPGITLTAEAIYEILDEAYEIAPVNEKMWDLFSPEKDYSDFFEYRKLLDWFHYHCYLNLWNETVLDEVLGNMYDNPDIGEEHLATLEYTAEVELSFVSRNNLLSMSSPEWLSRIMENKNHPQYAFFRDIVRKDYSWYLFHKEDKRYIYVTDLLEDKSTAICIEKRSLDKLSFVPEASCLSCVLIWYAGAWWQCGMCISNKISNLTDEQLASYNKKGAEKTNLRDYNNFMKASEGRPVMYFSSGNEMMDFFTTKMEYTSAPDFDLPKNFNKKILLSISKEDGLQVMTDGIECIKDPLNPFYDQASAKHGAINYYVCPGYCPLEVLYYLIENNFLPDAALNSVMGEEHGRKLLNDNRDFVLRYFLKYNGEKN